MNNQMKHPPLDRLQVFADQSLPEKERRDVEAHLKECESCTRALRAMQLLDSSLRALPLTKVRPNFTPLLMERLGIARPSTFIFQVLEKSAYVFGLVIVLAIIIAAFTVTGILDLTQVEQSQSRATGMLSGAFGEGGKIISAISEGLRSFMPFIFGKGSFTIAVFAVAVLALLAVADRIIEHRVFDKGR